ncbi:hypothetical protein QBZ16_001163 [Prototheca wickerhamii]|uniref:SAM-dependent MTase RsmB/NOP-type domain-containing protein n=1 Tax=Prototheca wickerhamii TaxID=3111 RepID=A0AAD9MM23_PROWI|nr:hypothetical protein QBZ16_001163 [Prototheca wickerhamii]
MPAQRLGVGTSLLARTEMFRAQHGVAIKMEQRVYRPGAPALDLPPGAVMLQNLPSLAAAAVLAPTPGSRVLDLCAAPGGKTTALAARVAGPGAGPRGTVIALDRSHSKAAQIRALAKECGVGEFVAAYKGDATKCPAMTEGLKRRLERKAAARRRHKQAPVTSAHLPEGKEPVCPGFPPASFDFVLCDAPCSALGLRPRLRHEQTLQELRGTAAYQRKILAAGVAALKPGGALVFSTCTISHLENEGNVRWLLDSYPNVRLVPAEPRIAGPGLQGLLTAEEASLVQRFDPGVQPAQEQGTHALDSIGFFIAKFVKAD